MRSAFFLYPGRHTAGGQFFNKFRMRCSSREE